MRLGGTVYQPIMISGRWTDALVEYRHMGEACVYILAVKDTGWSPSCVWDQISRWLQTQRHWPRIFPSPSLSLSTSLPPSLSLSLYLSPSLSLSTSLPLSLSTSLPPSLPPTRMFACDFILVQRVTRDLCIAMDSCALLTETRPVCVCVWALLDLKPPNIIQEEV